MNKLILVFSLLAISAFAGIIIDKNGKLAFGDHKVSSHTIKNLFDMEKSTPDTNKDVEKKAELTKKLQSAKKDVGHKETGKGTKNLLSFDRQSLNAYLAQKDVGLTKDHSGKIVPKSVKHVNGKKVIEGKDTISNFINGILNAAEEPNVKEFTVDKPGVQGKGNATYYSSAKGSGVKIQERLNLENDKIPTEVYYLKAGYDHEKIKGAYTQNQDYITADGQRFTILQQGKGTPDESEGDFAVSIMQENGDYESEARLWSNNKYGITKDTTLEVKGHNGIGIEEDPQLYGTYKITSNYHLPDHGNWVFKEEASFDISKFNEEEKQQIEDAYQAILDAKGVKTKKVEGKNYTLDLALLVENHIQDILIADQALNKELGESLVGFKLTYINGFKGYVVGDIEFHQLELGYQNEDGINVDYTAEIAQVYPEDKGYIINMSGNRKIEKIN